MFMERAVESVALLSEIALEKITNSTPSNATAV
jgi:hypothetical protein